MEVTECRIVDWYDGVVQALVRLAGKEAWFYCSLLAWDMRSNRKVFALLRLDNNWSHKLLSLLSEKTLEPNKQAAWDKFSGTVQSLLSTYDDRVLIVLCEELGEQVLARKMLPIDSFRDDLGQEVEESLGPERIRHWLSRFLTTLDHHAE